MGKHNEELMEAAKAAIDAAWSDTSVSLGTAVANMKELISHCKTNQQATESDIRRQSEE